MASFQSVDISQLPAPNVVEVLDFETIFAAMVVDLKARDPSFTALTESDPAFKILQVCAYRELLIRQRVNDAARSVMAAYAIGADLDNIAANYGVARLLITPADSAAIPPVAAIYEADDDLRARLLLSLERYTTAGSRASYQYWALSSSGDVKDVAVNSLAAGVVNIAVLSRTGSGAAPDATLALVTNALNAETVRPICDTVRVASAVVTNVTVTSSLTLMTGAMQADVLAAATIAVQNYFAQNSKLGRSITRAGVIGALMQIGVQNAVLTSPAADVVTNWNEAPYLAAINLSAGAVV